MAWGTWFCDVTRRGKDGSKKERRDGTRVGRGTVPRQVRCRAAGSKEGSCWLAHLLDKREGKERIGKVYLHIAERTAYRMYQRLHL